MWPVITPGPMKLKKWTTSQEETCACSRPREGYVVMPVGGGGMLVMATARIG